MANLEFSVPYNNDPETLEHFYKLKSFNDNRIREIYLSGPQCFSASGRIVDEIDEGKFVDIVNQIHKEGLRVNLVMNPTCEGLNWYKKEVIESKMDFLKRAHKEHGIETVTIANPLYVEETRKRFPNIEICASVLGDIDCVQRAVIYDRLGANVITPDVDVNRNLSLLRKMKNAVNAEFKLMVNDGCLYKCPFRRFHFNYISHKSVELGSVENDTFFAHCSEVIGQDHSQILKSNWIRPEDLDQYLDICSYFKIVGRARPTTKVIRATKAYMGQNWEGDLLDILSGGIHNVCMGEGASIDNKSLSRYNFFEKTTSCGYDCQKCNYCKDLIDKLFKLGALTLGKLEDMGLAEMADEFESKGILEY